MQNWHSLAGSAGYTWGHALDYETGQLPYLPQNSLDEAAEYGNSDWDVRQTLTGTLDYNRAHLRQSQPAHPGLGSRFGLLLPRRVPLHDLLLHNPSGNGENADRAVQIANPLAGISHAFVPATWTSGAYVQWFNPGAFEDAPAGTYSPTRRGQNYGPGYGAVDLALLKSTQIRESVSLQFRADMFNLFNRTNLALDRPPQHKRQQWRRDRRPPSAPSRQPRGRSRRAVQRAVLGEDSLLASASERRSERKRSGAQGKPGAAAVYGRFCGAVSVMP